MVIKNRLALSILIAALFTGVLSVVAAQLPMPKELELPMPEQSDKDEKQEKAEKEGKEKEATEEEEKVLRGLKKRIRFEIPDTLKLKDKNGKIEEEFLESMKEDVLSFESFATIINNQLDQNKHALIARDHKPSGKELAHYFDTEQLHRAFEAFQGIINPTNKQPVNLSYFAYVPEFKCFVHAVDASLGTYVREELLQEYADYAIVKKIFTDSSDPVQKERGKAKLIHLSDTATIEDIKNNARFNLVQLYLSEKTHDAEICILLKSLVNVPGKIAATAHAQLAIGHSVKGSKWLNREDALIHAFQAIKHPNIDLVPEDVCAAVFCMAGEFLMEQSDKPESRDALKVLETAVQLAEKTGQPRVEARAHAFLAFCYYNDPAYGEGRYTEGDGGRYVKAFEHCMKALQEYDVVKHVRGFLGLTAVVAKQYFARCTEEDINKKLVHLEQIKKSNPDKKLNDALQDLINAIQIIKASKKDGAALPAAPAAGLPLDMSLDGERKERDSKKRKASDESPLAGIPAAKKGSGAGSGSGSRSAAELDKD